MKEEQQSEPYILFELAGTYYGVRSSAVQQMEMVETVTPVPNAQPFVDGVVFSRGQVIPALNLRARFGFERAPYDLRTRLVVISCAGRAVGLLVDAAREFVAVRSDSIQAPHDAIAGINGRFVGGITTIGDRIVLVLDLDEVVRATDLAAEVH